MTNPDNIPPADKTVLELFDLTGKVALISGASGYLGSAFSQALAEAGASVIVSSREQKRADEVARSLPSPGGARHYGVEMDQVDDDSRARGFEQAVACCGQIDILINNGHHPTGEDWKSVTPAQFNEQLQNATAYFDLARRLHDHLAERKAAGHVVAGSVIMIGSMYGVVGSYPEAYKDVCNASPVAYHTLKGGIVHLTRHLAVYWANSGIRVNCLSPGPFPSEKAPAEMVTRLCEKSPMKRMGLPHELKGALIYFASDASSYVTGQNLLIDGGWTAW